MTRACRLLLTLALVGCGDDEPVAASTETAGSGAETTESGTDGQPEPDCVALAMTEVDHIAFEGNGCADAPDTSTMLSTQAEVDAHTAAYCQLCCSNCNAQDCKAPQLDAGSAIVYAHVNTPMGEAVLDILAVEDCGEHLRVTALETLGCQTAFDVGWDSVVVESAAKPVELVIEAGPDQCSEPP